MPWLDVADRQTSVTKVLFDSGKSILIASHVCGELKTLADNLNASERSSADTDFYGLARKIADRDFSSIPRLQNPRGGLSIYYKKSHKLRVYVAHIPAADVQKYMGGSASELDLVLRIALVSKPNENAVLKIIAER